MTQNGLLKTLGLAGAALAAGYLFQPKAGAKRRKRLGRGARNLLDSATTEFSRLGDTVSDAIPGIGSGSASTKSGKKHGKHKKK